MARTVKPEERLAKRNEILDATQRLVVTKGYERMTIQDILAELNISSGAFYHYFDSKPDVLDALVLRIREDTSAPLLAVVRDPQRSAPQKLRDFFLVLERLRNERQATVIALLRIWYDDSNAIVRQKVEAATMAWRAPLIAEIARQGVREGSFSTPFPEHAGELVLGLAEALAFAHASRLLGRSDETDEKRIVDEVLSLHAAFADAVERVLGAPPATLHRADAAAARRWLRALREDATAQSRRRTR
jgi:AcrR family transcriptional regulator